MLKSIFSTAVFTLRDSEQILLVAFKTKKIDQVYDLYKLMSNCIHLNAHNLSTINVGLYKSTLILKRNTGVY